MEFDDKIRSDLGVAICLRDMGNGKSRFFFDDIKVNKDQNPITWSYDSFYTFTSEFTNDEVNKMKLPEEQYTKIGEAVVARLLALNGSFE